MLEERLGRLNKLVLNGWDDRNDDRMVEWPSECVNVVDRLPRGGLQMAERTLTGEIGVYSTITPCPARADLDHRPRARLRARDRRRAACLPRSPTR